MTSAPALIAARGWEIDANDPAQLTLFPEMEAGADVPEITTACGPLTAAMLTSWRPSSSGSTSASGAAMASIAPPSGNACINRARAVTSAPSAAPSWSPRPTPSTPPASP